MSTAASGTKNTQRLMKVLLAPVVSEKSTFIGEKLNQYAFRVTSDATKPEIKAANLCMSTGLMTCWSKPACFSRASFF